MPHQIRESGYVRWPLHPPVEALGSGMWVYALVPADQTFAKCVGPTDTVLLPRPAKLARVVPGVYPPVALPSRAATPDHLSTPQEVWEFATAVEDRTHAEDDFGAPVLAAVCLGTVDALWRSPRGGYWSATVDDLHPGGRKLINQLHALYNIAPRLATYLVGHPSP